MPRQIGVAAAATTVALALATRTRRVQRWDDAIERRAARTRSRTQLVARLATLPGARFGHPAIGAAVALWILDVRGGRARRILVPLAAASIGAIAAHYGVKLFYRRPRPRVALRRGKREPAFPSGHTADATAVLATSAYLLLREDVAPPLVVVPVTALLAVGTGWSRVALGWHWASDVAGGWLAGIGVAAGCAATYEWLQGDLRGNV
ncbi:MAG TPA: phosphatase PAP2 family protein [Gemmatimonadaceae bacterium]|jgi:undecaprenyl-diphosphatase